MEHEPRDRLGLLRRKTQPPADPQRHPRALLRVIPAAALGQVVEQHGEIKRAARNHLVDHFARQRQFVDERAALDIRERADRPDGVLVDRVDVIHVVLRLGDDTA